MALTKITPQMFDTSAAGHDFNIDNGTFVVDASANRVGIGTSSPSLKFHSSETGGSTIAGLFQTNQTDSYISFQASGTTDNSTVRIGAVGDDLRAFVNGGFRFTITSAGNVGVGTTNPSTLLHVNGTATATTFVGALTGNVTGNVSGTAATVTGAAQANITSLGTLTALTVDNIGINGDTITLTGASATGFIQTSSNVMQLGTSTSDNLILYTNNTPALTIDSSQNATFAGTISGTLATAAQTNITSVGTLTGLATTGNIVVTKSSAKVEVTESSGASVRMIAGGSTGYIGNYSNHTLQILTNSTPAVHIDNGQNVGIGVAPSTSNNMGDVKLQLGTNYAVGGAYSAFGETKNSQTTIVGNNIRPVIGTNNQVMRHYNGSDAGNFMKIAYNKGFTFHTGITTTQGTGVSEDTNERVRIDTSGNVGINQSSPAAKLDIKGDTTTYGGMAKIYLTDTASNSESRNWAIGNGGSGFGHFTIGRSVSKNGDPLNGNHTTPFVIDHEDNVGIGTQSPGATLHVDPAANVTTSLGSPLIKVGGDNSWAGNGSLYSIGFGYLDTSISNKSPAEIGIVTTSNAGYTKGDLVFATRDTTGNDTPTERMRILSSGVVKIPTPGNTLDGTYYSTITVNNTGSSTYSRLRFDRSGSERWGLGLRPDDKFHIAKFFNTASDDTFVINSSGHIGLNTDTPSVPLHLYAGANAAQFRIEGVANNFVYMGNDNTGTYIENVGTSAPRRQIRVQSSNGSGGYTQLFVDGANKEVQISTPVDGNLLLTSQQFQVVGGFGGKTTTGNTDWNHSTNARSGNGYTLLLGSSTNGPTPSNNSYYHIFNYEYNTKDGSGNLTQLAIGYNINAMYIRYRYSGSWTSWTQL
tara:strand:- start:384 stop:2981 length:2598 start_codon:yes stop_codon:yes gene_type:complete